MVDLSRRSFIKTMPIIRKLAAILAIDVVGFSSLIGADEVGTIRRLNALHREQVRPIILKHNGRVLKLMGDGLLAEFASVVKSVECAVDIQMTLSDASKEADEEQPIRLRMGINFGDVVVEGDDILGDGVNIAARVEALANPGGLCVSGKVYDEIFGRLDVPFEDIGEQQLKNIERPIRIWRWVTNEPATQSEPAGRSGSRPSSYRPSIAVLPFENMDGDPDNNYFSDGIAEDITTELSRFGSLFVVSRHSAFRYRDRTLDVRQVGRELGAQFLLTGSVRQIGNRLRVTVQLNNVEDRSSIWAERFDRDKEDLFALQDEITEKVASTAAGQVKAIDTERARRKNPNNLEAYDYFLRGLDLHKGRESGLQTAREAVSMFDKAIELDRGFARAHAWKACAFANTWVNGRTDALLEEALATVTTAIKLDPGESEAHRILGAICLTKRDYERAEKHYERARELNPNDSDILAQTSNFYSFVGRPAEALSSIQRAMDLNPHHDDWYWAEMGLAQFAAGDCAAAIDAFLNCATPRELDLAVMAAASALVGLEKEAQDYANRLTAENPGITIETVLENEPFRLPEDRERIERGLKIAGLASQ